MIKLFNLHLFDEGGSAVTGGDVGGSLADTQTEMTEEISRQDTETEAENEEVTKPSFDDLINGEYKEDYKKSVNKVVRNRLKGAKETENRLNSFTPLLEMLATRYGIDTDDISKVDAQTFMDKMLDDDSIYENESLDTNIPVDTLKRMKRMEFENANMKKQLEADALEQQRRAEFDAKLQEAEELKEYYPNFDLAYELQQAEESNQNAQDFIRLLQNNVPMKIAFEVTHPEVITNAMKSVAQIASEKVANSVKANKRRAKEGGGGITGTPAKLNPATMTSKQIRELRERALSGEHIVL